MATRDIKDTIEDGGERIADTAKGGVDDAKGEFRKFSAKLRANGAQLEDELRDAGERISEGAKKFGDAAVEQIREHPLAAFGIAFAAGVLISRVMRSR
jgi:ElaB/YqjD/DUF883 family membrane-anchored ribosome-binding protein